jgi:hypothetical protein
LPDGPWIFSRAGLATSAARTITERPEGGALDEADVSFNARHRRSRNADKAAALT